MRGLTRRDLVLAAVATPMVARAQSNTAAWPSGNVRIVVPYPPGGSTDVIARMVQPGLQQRLGTTVVVENKPGGSGSVGADLIAKSPPDGSNWLFTFDNHAGGRAARRADPQAIGRIPTGPVRPRRPRRTRQIRA